MTLGNSKVPRRILAIDPYTRGIGFVVLEGDTTLLDWGLKEARRDKHVRCLSLVANLIEMYQPDVVVVEDVRDKSCHRCARVRELIQSIEQLAKEKNVKALSFSRRTVQAAFSTSQDVTKHQIACFVVERFPELAPWQPPIRKPWMPEDERSSIFDAAALVLTAICRGAEISFDGD